MGNVGTGGGSLLCNGIGDGNFGGGGFPEGGALILCGGMLPFAAVGGGAAVVTADVSSRGPRTNVTLPTGGSGGDGLGTAVVTADSIVTSTFSSTASSTSIAVIGSETPVPDEDAGTFAPDALAADGIGNTSANGPLSGSPSILNNCSGVSVM